MPGVRGRCLLSCGATAQVCGNSMECATRSTTAVLVAPVVVVVAVVSVVVYVVPVVSVVAFVDPVDYYLCGTPCYIQDCTLPQ